MEEPAGVEVAVSGTGALGGVVGPGFVAQPRGIRDRPAANIKPSSRRTGSFFMEGLYAKAR